MTNAHGKQISALALLALALASLSPAAEEAKQGQGEKAADPLRQLAEATGLDAGAWRFTDRHNRETKDVEFEIVEKNGRTAVRAGRNYLVVATAEDKPLPAGTDVRIAFSFAKRDRGNAFVSCEAGQKPGAEEPTPATQCSVTHRAGRDRLRWRVQDPFADPSDRRAHPRGVFSPQGIRHRRLGWPDWLRRHIEHQMAQAPELAGYWNELRAVLLEDGIRLYLNGHLLMERRGDALTGAGRFQVQLSAHALLGGIAVSQAPPEADRFEAVDLRFQLNSAALNGQPLHEKSLATLRGTADLGGVPFDVPEPDADGKSHIDLGVSWLQTGTMEGQQQANRGGIGGRWQGPFYHNPSRIQFAVPAKRYTAVHLLAAADNDDNSVPAVSAQFFKIGCGFPVQFEKEVPLFTAKAETLDAVPVRLADGTEGSLYHIRIPVAPGMLAGFDGFDQVGLELTKKIRLLRTAPDPTHYSFHGAGLPSSVRVFAVTLEEPALEMDVEAGVFGECWEAPERPAYTVTLHNPTPNARFASIDCLAVSRDGTHKQRILKSLELQPDETKRIPTTFSPERYGHHNATFQLTSGGMEWQEERAFAWLHPDTRERGDWQKGRGPIFGFWNWRGGHRTPPGYRQTYIMGLAGAESSSGSFAQARVDDAERSVARRFGMVTFKRFGGGDHYITNRFMGNLHEQGLEKAREVFLEQLKKSDSEPSDIHRPELISFFPEPHLGPVSYGTLPSYYGEPEHTMTDYEKQRYERYLPGFVEGAKIVNKHYPGTHCMLPHGDPLFPAMFLRHSPEARKLIDGATVDIPCFERLPEQQIHQVSIHRMYMCREEFRKAGIEKPLLPMYEGPCLPSHPGALTNQELADLSVRNSLVLIAYGVDRQCGGWAPFDSGSYWGEQHYGGGIYTRLPEGKPKPAYSAFATMTRHLNRRNFIRWVPTGSLSAYCLEFAHYRTGETMHALWTVRGERTVFVQPTNGTKKIVAYGPMDNQMDLQRRDDGSVGIRVTPSPCWVYGLTGNERITLGEPDHSDAAPGELAVEIGNLGDGSWSQETTPDEDYQTSHEEFVVRFPGEFSATVADAPTPQGGKALAVHLGKQESVRKIMPFFTALTPEAPIEIPGRASHLGLWVKAHSDWGRVVYCLRDAEGERWLSVGQKGHWNCDDIHSDSAFCFDGWRYLTFELPANAPYDRFRLKGSTWWGHYGKGNAQVDLPLRIETIIVERRTHAMYVNSPEPADRSDVLLGDLYAEYEDEAARTPQAVELDKVRMAPPEGAPALDNPIQRLAEKGKLAPATITRVEPPDHHADGTQCHVYFEPVGAAARYQVWASPYKDGRGALQVGRNWTEPGGLIRGLRPQTDFYLFLVYETEDKKTSTPSPPFKINLVDRFAMK